MLRLAVLATLLAGCSGEALALAYVAQGAFELHAFDFDGGDDKPDETESRIAYKHAIKPCTTGDADACLTVAIFLDRHEQNADGTIAAYEYACANGKQFACARLTSDTWFSTRRTAFRR